MPNFGTQEPQKDFRGEWQTCRPETAAGFSAVGYFFGRQLHQTLGVPVGLINDSWGGSACEAWIRRDVLAADPKFALMLKRWEQIEKDYPRAKAEYDSKMADWKLAAKKAKDEGKQPPQAPLNPGMMAGNSRPGNIYNGVLKPTIGYGIRGVIWYQGESNAGKAYQYRDLFPLMIKSWRDEWGQGDFSFYWVQLADFLPESPEPKESAWAELREAQTMTMSRLPKTGEAVIIDLGEAQDIHPRNKQDVANRLARWALARDYGVKIPYQSPTYKSMEKQGQQDRAPVRPRGRRPEDRPMSRTARIRHRRQRPQVRESQGEDRRPRHHRGVVRPGVRAGCRTLRLGRQPRLQRVQRRRPAPDAIPNRRLARCHHQ